MLSAVFLGGILAGIRSALSSWEAFWLEYALRCLPERHCGLNTLCAVFLGSTLALEKKSVMDADVRRRLAVGEELEHKVAVVRLLSAARARLAVLRCAWLPCPLLRWRPPRGVTGLYHCQARAMTWFRLRVPSGGGAQVEADLAHMMQRGEQSALTVSSAEDQRLAAEAELRRAKLTVESLAKERVDLEDQLRHAKEEAEASGTRAKSWEKQATEEGDKLWSLEQELQSTKASVSELRLRAEEVQELGRQKTELEGELRQAKGDLELTKQSAASWAERAKQDRQRVLELERENQAARATASSLSDRLEEAVREKASVEANVGHLRERIEDIEQRASLAARGSPNLGELGHAKSELEQQLRGAKEQLARSEQTSTGWQEQATKDKQRIEKLQGECQEYQTKIKQLTNSLDEAKQDRKAHDLVVQQCQALQAQVGALQGAEQAAVQRTKLLSSQLAEQEAQARDSESDKEAMAAERAAALDAQQQLAARVLTLQETTQEMQSRLGDSKSALDREAAANKSLGRDMSERERIVQLLCAENEDLKVQLARISQQSSPTNSTANTSDKRLMPVTPRSQASNLQHHLNDNLRLINLIEEKMRIPSTDSHEGRPDDASSHSPPERFKVGVQHTAVDAGRRTRWSSENMEAVAGSPLPLVPVSARGPRRSEEHRTHQATWQSHSSVSEEHHHQQQRRQYTVRQSHSSASGSVSMKEEDRMGEAPLSPHTAMHKAKRYKSHAKQLHQKLQQQAAMYKKVCSVYEDELRKARSGQGGLVPGVSPGSTAEVPQDESQLVPARNYDPSAGPGPIHVYSVHELQGQWGLVKIPDASNSDEKKTPPSAR
ncbi:hypothetical protein CYMTET_25856 [Cymbomonas tetramitiformis]|uniref:Uncharacterized protein n=1 Tax=Cymbomonas tetramitiformis TaxID=36881 RepID=A0AAE0FT87_9CHLO|nr:hypothetical protein CYMTET_25856 [Cymbomonas tetramitiformis]